jgi:hypothetical protein
MTNWKSSVAVTLGIDTDCITSSHQSCAYHIEHNIIYERTKENTLTE